VVFVLLLFGDTLCLTQLRSKNCFIFREGYSMWSDNGDSGRSLSYPPSPSRPGSLGERRRKRRELPSRKRCFNVSYAILCDFRHVLDSAFWKLAVRNNNTKNTKKLYLGLVKSHIFPWRHWSGHLSEWRTGTTASFKNAVAVTYTRQLHVKSR